MSKLPHHDPVSDLRAVMQSPIERPKQSRPRLGLAGFILTSALGFFAGVVGGLIATSVILPAPSLLPELIFRRASGTSSFRSTEQMPALSPIIASVVDLFFVGKAEGASTLLPLDRRTGRGVALTSDGWIVTTKRALPAAVNPHVDARWPVVVGHDRRIRAVDRIAFDPISELAFVHVTDLEAAVIPLRNRSELNIGVPLFVPTVEGGIEQVALRAPAALDTAAKIQSSDQWFSLLALAPASSAMAGTPVVDAGGALVGLLTGVGDRAVPTDAIASAIPSLFTRGAVERNILGVTCRDASAYGVGPGERLEGLILARDRDAKGKFLPVFTTASPLRGKLEEGDVIIAVGDDPLTAKRFLVELLQEYPLGATVTLRVLAHGAPKDFTVPLARARGDVLLVTAAPKND